MVDPPLARNEMWNMRITEQRNAVGTEVFGPSQRIREIGADLARQAIHQIEIERANAGVAEQLDTALDHAQRLNAANRLLQMRGEGLHAHAGVLRPDRLDHRTPFLGQRAGIELYGVERRVEWEVRRNGVHQAEEIVRWERIRTAAAERDPLHPCTGRQPLGNQCDLTM